MAIKINSRRWMAEIDINGRKLEVGKFLTKRQAIAYERNFVKRVAQLDNISLSTTELTFINQNPHKREASGVKHRRIR